MAQKITFASVVKNRGFRFLWFNQILVQLAYNTLNFALIIWVFKLVNSNFAVAGLMLSVYLPVILFGIFAGVFVDIMDRKKIILFVDFFLAASFLLFIFIKSSYLLILLNAFLVNSLAQFFLPSESSSIPLLLSKKQLFVANSLFSLTLYGAFMVGFSLGGPILNHLGINAVFYLGALLLFLAFILAQNLPSIKTRYFKKEFNRLSLGNFTKMLQLTLGEIKNIFEFIQGKPPVIAAIGLLAAIQGIIGMMAVMMPSYLERVLLIHATDASYFLMLPLGLGMVIGAFLVGRLFVGVSRRSIVVPAVIASGLLIILIGTVPFLGHILQSSEVLNHISRPRYFFKVPSLSIIFALIAFLVGFCFVSIIIPCQTVLQENTTEKNRGKIFAVLAVVMTGFASIPVILAGGLSDLFGVTPIVIGLGMAIFISGILAWHPSLFFKEGHLPFRLREFLGLGHWNN